MIKPKSNIHVQRPKAGNNPQFIEVSVSGPEYRDLVNRYSLAAWNEDSLFGEREIIMEGKLAGHTCVNKCYDVEEVCQLIESLTLDNQEEANNE